ncbi:NUDIX domain-containing protein [Nakamurella sp. YIM 132087]|uniref:NUDIX domain-containing protein n=1 Tax=Nakamurella alba TaxID=2665158 RepID=A0A7K1FR67_9ACTN|nr:NUDIX domain-containing protein [Nakamurella alba]MTD16642.1 NUDIX domain-containing protein [Nakamurella alba]
MPHRSRSSSGGHPADTSVEVLAAVFTVRAPVAAPGGVPEVHVLLWQRALDPDAGRWALPGGTVLPDEDVDSSAARQLAAKVDLTRVAHLEQIGVFSDPDRVPDARVVATGFLGLVPLDADPVLPPDTAWHPVSRLPDTALDHGAIVGRAADRLRAKLSYTNIAFALAPAEFTVAELRRIYSAALGHDVDPTNLQRVLTRRGMLAPTGTTAAPGPSGGRPAALHRFTISDLRVTDPFAAFRPPER